MNVEEKRSQATREDLARATLQTILNNIGLIEYEQGNVEGALKRWQTVIDSESCSDWLK